jgi:hypothetical protein
MNQSAIPPVIKEPPRSIQFSFSLFDLIKCRLWVIHHHKLLMGMYLFFSILVPSMNLNDSKLAAHTFGIRAFVFVFTAVIVLFFMSALNIVLQVIMAISAKNRGLVGTHKIEAGDECLTETTEFNASTFRWSGFHKLSESANYLFLYVAENNVLYIPKGSFSSVQAMNDFKNFILQKTRKS